MEPDHGMVKFGGPFARTTWALTAIWLGDGRRAVAVPGIQRLRSQRGSTFHDLSVGENGGERTRLRPRGGRDQGSHRAGEDMDRLPLAASCRGADNADNCRRGVDSDGSSFSAPGSPEAP